jgi:hypothetical protein
MATHMDVDMDMDIDLSYAVEEAMIPETETMAEDITVSPWQTFSPNKTRQN